MIMYQIYKIVTTPMSGNSHGVCREENWNLVKDKSFNNLPDAETYVIFKNRQQASHELGLMYCNNYKVWRKRCLEDDEWLSRRKYFIGRPDVQKIKQQLQERHIDVI